MNVEEFVEFQKELVLAPDTVIKKEYMREALTIIEAQRDALRQISKFDAYHREWPEDAYVNAPPEEIARAALGMEV
jgi:hypothetical protein